MDAFADLSSLPPEKRWRAQSAPVPAVVALIRRSSAAGEELLLIQRAGGPYTGQWALVGGKWDFGETLAEAIIREVWEETGLVTGFVAVRAVVSERVAPWATGDKAAHFLLLVCDLIVTEGNASEQYEGLVQWFDRPTLETLYGEGRVIPSDYAIIREFVGSSFRAPYVEVEMRALLDGSAAHPSQMLRFQRFDLMDKGE